VDYFIIVEATYTQTGMPKPLNFDRAKFNAFESKIIYVVAENPPGGVVDPWRNENAQRDAISRGLESAGDDDWLIVSDVDEIPNPSCLKLYNSKYKTDIINIMNHTGFFPELFTFSCEKKILSTNIYCKYIFRAKNRSKVFSVMIDNNSTFYPLRF
jgi:hypothetical protein